MGKKSRKRARARCRWVMPSGDECGALAVAVVAEAELITEHVGIMVTTRSTAPGFVCTEHATAAERQGKAREPLP